MEASERKDRERVEEAASPDDEAARQESERILCELEKEFGEDLNPALRRVLKKRKAIRKWLREPENAAAFKRDPVQALSGQFPGLDLEIALKAGLGPPVTLGGVDLSGVDQETLDFFAEVWKYVAESPVNANAFKANPGKTITLLGQGKPAQAVQRVAEALHVSGSGSVDMTGIAKIAREKLFREVFNPIGPMPGPGRTILTELRLPPDDEEGP